MRYLSLFDDFSLVEEHYNFDSVSLIESKINQMFSLKENGCLSGFSMEEFKDFFRSQSLLESRGEEESELLLEKAYSVYELGMLHESKSHWFDEDKPLIFEHGRGVISYLEYEGNIFLFKEGEAFKINERSLRMLKERDQFINENIFDELLDNKLYEFWSWTDNPIINNIKGAAKWTKKNIVEPTKNVVKDYVAEPLKKTYNALSDGAKKVYEFSKKVLSAVATFLKENWEDIIFYYSVALQVIAGIVSCIPAAGQLVGPILLIVAGALQIFLGGKDIYDGLKITKECPTAPKEKAAKEFLTGGVKVMAGSGSLILGICDIVTSAKAAVPGASATSVAASIGFKSWAYKVTTGFGKKAGAALGLFETVIKWLIEKGGEKLAAKAAKKGVEIAVKAGTKAGAEILGKKLGDVSTEAAEEAAVPIICMAGQYGLGWAWDIFTGAVAGIAKILNGLLDIPTKVVNGINSFNKKYSDKWWGSVLGGALNTFVKPVAKVMSYFCEKVLKPVFKPVTNWMLSLDKGNKTISKSIKSNPELVSVLKGTPAPPESKMKPISTEKVEITSSDKKNIAKIQTSNAGKKLDKNMAKQGGFYNKDFKKAQKENLEKVKKQEQKISKPSPKKELKSKNESMNYLKGFDSFSLI